MEFTNNFYVQVKEQSTGSYAFELLVDRYMGAVYPEPGPNMVWNTKYGHMGALMPGMMGGRTRGWAPHSMMGGWQTAQPAGEMTLTPAQARTLAQTYVKNALPGVTVDEQADTFYGYYTLHTLRNSQIEGMLSVNGYTGQIWYHTWHGEFLNLVDYAGEH
jgi:hypothetical protein